MHRILIFIAFAGMMLSCQRQTSYAKNMDEQSLWLLDKLQSTDRVIGYVNEPMGYASLEGVVEHSCKEEPVTFTSLKQEPASTRLVCTEVHNPVAFWVTVKGDDSVLPAIADYDWFKRYSQKKLTLKPVIFSNGQKILIPAD